MPEVVAGPAYPLESLVPQQVKVPLSLVVDALGHHGAGQGVCVGGEESRDMMINIDVLQV